MNSKTEGTGELNGFLDAGSQIQGELRFEDTFRVDGGLSGKIASKGDLVVGRGGEVEGEVEVGSLFVSGTVKGTVKASGRVEISSGARFEADVETPALVIEEGAHFHGRCVMNERTGSTAPNGAADRQT